MEQTTAVSSISLLLIITYYTLHGWRELRHDWRGVKRRLTCRDDSGWCKWKVLDLLGVFLLSGCVQAGPIIFYGLHLSEVLRWLHLA